MNAGLAPVTGSNDIVRMYNDIVHQVIIQVKENCAFHGADDVAQNLVVELIAMCSRPKYCLARCMELYRMCNVISSVTLSFGLTRPFLRHFPIEEPPPFAIAGLPRRPVIVEIEDTAAIGTHPVIVPPDSPRTAM